jgi:hypothetical protein
MKYNVESFHGEVVRLKKVPCSSGHLKKGKAVPLHATKALGWGERRDSS